MLQLAVFQQSQTTAGPKQSAVLVQCLSTAAPCYLLDTPCSSTDHVSNKSLQYHLDTCSQVKI